jgi:hypothetical protein
MSTHTLTTTIPHGPADIGAEVELEITFNFTAGAAPIFHPADEACPGYPDAIELVSCKGPINHPAYADLEQQQLNDIAEAWLESDDGREAALLQAADDNERDREYAAELRAEVQ